MAIVNVIYGILGNVQINKDHILSKENLQSAKPTVFPLATEIVADEAVLKNLSTQLDQCREEIFSILDKMQRGLLGGSDLGNNIKNILGTSGSRILKTIQDYNSWRAVPLFSRNHNKQQPLTSAAYRGALFAILSFLPVKDILTFSTCCRYFYDVASDDQVWNLRIQTLPNKDQKTNNNALAKHRFFELTKPKKQHCFLVYEDTENGLAVTKYWPDELLDFFDKECRFRNGQIYYRPMAIDGSHLFESLQQAEAFLSGQPKKGPRYIIEIALPKQNVVDSMVDKADYRYSNSIFVSKLMNLLRTYIHSVHPDTYTKATYEDLIGQIPGRVYFKYGTSYFHQIDHEPGSLVPPRFPALNGKS